MLVGDVVVFVRGSMTGVGWGTRWAAKVMVEVGGAGRMRGLEKEVPMGRGEAAAAGAAAAGARMMVVRGVEKSPCTCGTPLPLGRI
ncbi:hypothetical protein E2C01_089243 [Portunus trituberculatus]|uniref:Uncharacterized protein n=1 Tax=Portunus trituberculatus TaxID=210409 RepID=A0A5B7J898_PORTR|nr:hypothetical protein [Portunus trituberculatus]